VNVSSEDDFAAIVQSIADAEPKKPQSQSSAVISASAVLPFSLPLMVDLIVQNPSWSHKDLGQAFGKSASWVAQVLSMKSFQEVLDPRRHEVLNPEYAMTLEERFAALTIRSVTVLQEKLEKGVALPDLTVLKVAELGVKALGMGLKKKEDDAKPDEQPKNTSEAVAEKIMAAMQKRRNASAVDVEATEVKSGERPADPT
jgi:hypothetical protein